MTTLNLNMFKAAPGTGRGAWTIVGIGPNGIYYQVGPSSQQVGMPAAEDPALDVGCVDYRAVNWGVKQIQSRCNELVKAKLVVDGWFGQRTEAAVVAVQAQIGLVPDGIVGRITAKALWRPLVISAEAAHGLGEPHYLGGIMAHESNFDPGAVGYMSPGDKGLYQWNSVALTSAFDYHWSIPQTASRFAAAWQKYSGRGSKLQVACSIAQHNAPSYAAEWYATGQPPTIPISDYVAAVLAEATVF